MMKAEELRLLNKVYGPNNCILTVLEITAQGITYDCEHECCEFMEWDKIEPIPLTLEILERSGFEQKWGVGYSKITGHFILEWDDIPGLYLDIEGQQLSLSHVSTLHQLMNLFHALTGTALQITPQ